MNIMDLFRAPAPATPATSAAAPMENPAAPMTQAGVTNTPPPAETTGNPQDGKSTPAANPLDEFKTIFDNAGTQQGPGVPQLNADMTKIQAVAKQIDFSKNINPELAQKALGGDVNALGQMMNEFGRGIFAIATQASSHLIDKQSSAVSEHMQGGLSNQIKSFQANDLLRSENPALSHEAVQPLLSVIQTQLSRQYPTATAGELAAHAKKYFGAVLSAISPAPEPKQTSGQQKAQEQNKFEWDKWAAADFKDS